MNRFNQILSAHHYGGRSRFIAHQIKALEYDALREAAHDMAELIDSSYVLVPAPSHLGLATDSLALAQFISELSGAQVADVLKGRPRLSNYFAKLNGTPLIPSDMDIHSVVSLHGNIAVVDNVIDSGATAIACAEALGACSMLSYAMTNNLHHGQKY